jgi:hypothetical protein
MGLPGRLETPPVFYQTLAVEGHLHRSPEPCSIEARPEKIFWVAAVRQSFPVSPRSIQDPFAYPRVKSRQKVERGRRLTEGTQRPEIRADGATAAPTSERRSAW